MIISEGSNSKRVILSSLPLQVLFYFSGWYSTIYVVLSLGLYIYKDYRFYYPSSALAMEIVIVIMYAVTQASRLYMGSKGNKTESFYQLVMSILLALPVTLAYSYLIALQTYVLRVELILGIIGVIFIGLETLLSIPTSFNFFNSFPE